jgi:hypothetical protein
MRMRRSLADSFVPAGVVVVVGESDEAVVKIYPRGCARIPPRSRQHNATTATMLSLLTKSPRVVCELVLELRGADPNIFRPCFISVHVLLFF